MSLDITRSDVAAIQVLIEECLEQWDDPGDWQDHLVREVARLTGATLATFAVVLRRTDTIEMVEGWVEHFDTDAIVRRAFTQVMREGAALFPLAPRRLERILIDGWLTASYPELLDGCADAEKGALYFERFLQPVGTRWYLCASSAFERERFAVLSLIRSTGERDFSQREREIVTLISNAIAARCGRRLTLQTQAGGQRLARREKQVLAALLEGDSEKQIAARLGLSTATVHEYVTSLYRYYRAHSRGELLARFVRRTGVRSSDSGARADQPVVAPLFSGISQPRRRR